MGRRARGLLAAITLAAVAFQARPAAAQAFTPPRRMGAITLAWQYIDNTGHRLQRRLLRRARAEREPVDPARRRLRADGPPGRHRRNPLRVREVHGLVAATLGHRPRRLPVLDLRSSGLLVRRAPSLRERVLGRHASRPIRTTQPRLPLPGGSSPRQEPHRVPAGRRDRRAARGLGLASQPPGELHLCLRRAGARRDLGQSQQCVRRDRLRGAPQAVPARSGDLAADARRAAARLRHRRPIPFAGRGTTHPSAGRRPTSFGGSTTGTSRGGWPSMPAPSTSSRPTSGTSPERTPTPARRSRSAPPGTSTPRTRRSEPRRGERARALQ